VENIPHRKGVVENRDLDRVMGSRTIRGLRHISTARGDRTYRTEARLGAVVSDLARTDCRVERDAARIACLTGVRSIVWVWVEVYEVYEMYALCTIGAAEVVSPLP
jgi:hypothetical protein